ncbi:hypothetical protein McpSp1_05360 [Methanocorpusculaceae archaeon Sp1]|nr:hypothetical protein [Methanocorpusculaceae archaeon Sp1]
MSEERVFTSSVYRCLSCGFGFSTGGWTQVSFPPPPKPAPILVCPRCGCSAFLTEGSETYTVDEYIKLRGEVKGILRRRVMEAVV